MATSDQVAFVQSKLTAGETVVSCQEASLMKEWVRTSRILVLTEHGGSHAFLVFIPNKIPPQSASDLTLEQALPIDAEFKCEIDPDCKYQDAVDVYVNISSKKLKLLFEMVPGVKTSNFVEEVFRAVEVFTKHRGPPPEFSWLESYPSMLTNRTSGESFKCDNTDSSESGQDHIEKQSVELRNETRNAKKRSTYHCLLELENSELVVPRQSIAKGITPIAARESVIRYQMAMKEDDYTDTHIFRIFVGTYNVNGQPPSTVGLNDWLQHDEEPPDLYAIGFQELDLSKEAFLFNDTPREEEWMRAVINALHPKGRYLKVRLVRLVGMMLLVFVQEQHRAYIRNVASETVGTGIMGKMGNKGGVAIRIDLHSTSICFVNSHLAAHVEEYARRNQDYHDIYSRLVFSQFAPPKAIKDHDQVYWLGDLNYRVNLDAKVVKDYIVQENFAPVLEYDQLKQQHDLKQVFAGYQEGVINFKPTYKYDPGTDEWDSSEKNRAPAWCDRILWKGDGISLSEYRSHPSLKLSDHKPVSSIFDSEVRVIDSAKYRRIHEDVMKKLDKLENEFLPQVMVDNTEIVLDTVRYLELQKKELIIANTGQVPVQFEFIKKLDDKSFCKGWLSIEPYLGFIMPGEKCDITLEVYVDKKSACKLNSGEDKLYDILVLHLEGGKDIFITVTGTYERSCFGLSIEALVYITVPVRDIPVGKLMELENGTCREAPSGQDPYPVPKEIWFLVDHLYRNGLDQQHLFEHPGLHSELVNIRNWLDAGSADPLPGSVHSVAESLLLLLESTSEPLVPYNLHDVCLHSASNYLQCKQLVQEQLPEHRKNVFLYLCSFLQEVLNHSDKNGLDAKCLATLFGGIFLREPPRTSGGAGKPRSHQQDRKKAHFVYHFLVNNQSDFILNR